MIWEALPSAGWLTGCFLCGLVAAVFSKLIASALGLSSASRG
jgi:hypothetical protein